MKLSHGLRPTPGNLARSDRRSATPGHPVRRHRGVRRRRGSGVRPAFTGASEPRLRYRSRPDRAPTVALYGELRRHAGRDRRLARHLARAALCAEPESDAAQPRTGRAGRRRAPLAGLEPEKLPFERDRVELAGCVLTERAQLVDRADLLDVAGLVAVEHEAPGGA